MEDEPKREFKDTLLGPDAAERAVAALRGVKLGGGGGYKTTVPLADDSALTLQAQGLANLARGKRPTLGINWRKEF